jgi:hypothetical protein
MGWMLRVEIPMLINPMGILIINLLLLVDLFTIFYLPKGWN